MKIILLMGVQGSGKDFYATQYGEQHRDEQVVRMKFAQPLRDIVQIIQKVNLTNDLTYEGWKSIPENRQILIDLSVYLKRIYGQHVLVRGTLAHLRALYKIIPEATFIFTDCRFPFEYSFLKEFAEEIPGSSFQVIFCNYKSDRYKHDPSQITERWALHVLGMLGDIDYGTDITTDLQDNPLLFIQCNQL